MAETKFTTKYEFAELRYFDHNGRQASFTVVQEPYKAVALNVEHKVIGIVLAELSADGWLIAYANTEPFGTGSMTTVWMQREVQS